jgi:hypothetical protein
MMKKIISTLFLTTGLLLSAQVGINTNSPKAQLDVNGDMSFRGKIAVLDAAGNAFEGNNDQLLVSVVKDMLLYGNHFVFRNMNRISFI